MAEIGSDGEAEIFRSEGGGEFKCCFSEVCGRYRTEYEFMTAITSELNKCAECSLPILEVALLTARVCGSSLFGEVEMPNTTNSLWAETMN